MSESNLPGSTRYFKLGMFVIVGALLLVSGVLVLGGASIFERAIQAQTILTESVNGLDVGAAVKYRGVTIGKVAEIDVAGAKYGLDPDEGSAATGAGVIVVEMLIQSKDFPGKTNAQIETLLHKLADQGLRARVTTAGFSGQAFLELNFLDPRAYPPPQIGFKPTELYIPSAPSEMNQALEAVEHIAIDLQKANLPQLVAHYDQLATHATAAVDGVNDLVQKNRSAVNAAITDFRALLHDAQAILAEDKDDLRGILADLRRAAADAAIITDDARQNPARTFFGQPPAHLKEGQ
jgi:paraquat-inducible protein B